MPGSFLTVAAQQKGPASLKNSQAKFLSAGNPGIPQKLKSRLFQGQRQTHSLNYESKDWLQLIYPCKKIFFDRAIDERDS